MPNKELNTYRDFADNLLCTLGEKISALFVGPDDFNVRYKTRTNLVTDIDCWMEDSIRAAITQQFPGHQVIGEETADDLVKQTGRTIGELCSTGHCWLVDPLDGTTNFVNSIPIYAISAALFINGQRSVGLVYDVSRKEMFSAIRGQGAFLNKQKITVAQKSEILDAVIGLGYPHTSIEEWGAFRDVYEMFLKETRAIRRFGSSTIEQCWVACGRLDGVFESFMRPWDVAAGSLILEEAGGLVRNCESMENGEFDVFGNSYLAANKSIFPEIFRLAQDALVILMKKHQQ